jgi:hypothetical protein
MKKWLAAALCVLALGSTAARADYDVFGIGTGNDGALDVTTSNTVINSYAPVPVALAAGARSIAVGPCVGVSPCFAADDLVMVYQAASPEQTPPVDLSNNPVGRWEFARLASVTDSTLELTAPLVYAYAANVTQVIRVPEYSSVTINSGQSITAPAWNGSTGGIVAFLATGQVTNNGLINANGIGFRGGQYITDPSGARGCEGEDEPPPSGAQKGEGISNSRYGPTQTGRGNVANGAGGGVCLKSGGGGGGNGGAGGQGGRSESGADVGGRGGAALTYSALNHFTFGGGGGAGHGSTNTGAAGGNGGGAIFIRGNQLTGSGSISASGSLGGTSASDGGGGGGAGGAIYLRFVRTAACGSVLAAGGIGGNVNATRVGPGGGGGGGRVLFQAAPGGTCSPSATGSAAGVQQDPSEPAYGAQAGSNGTPTVIPRGLVLPSVPTVVTPANNSITSNRRPVITGTAQPPNADVIIYLDGNEIGRTKSDANGNYSLTPPADLADGSHTVQAVSEFEELRSLRSTINTFIVDTTPPDTTIVSGPSGFTRELNATFAFSSNEENVTYECRLDGATTFTSCPSPVTFSNLTVGTHSLVVRARDAAGNVDESPATRTFQITEADLSLLGSGYGCSATGRDSSLVLMSLGAFASLARRRRRN